MRRILGGAGLAVLAVAAGCAWLGGTPTGSCYTTRLADARLFAVEAPATASANATVSLTPWVSLTASVTKLDQVATPSFKAEVDVAARTITVSGQVVRTEATPGSGCTYPLLAVPPEPASLSVEFTAPAGTYDIRIPSAFFTSDRPHAVPSMKLPEAAATRSLVLE